MSDSSILVCLLIVACIIYFCCFYTSFGPNNNYAEGFYPYTPCVYNLQNRLVCSPAFDIPPPVWTGAQYNYNYDLRGDPLVPGYVDPVEVAKVVTDPLYPRYDRQYYNNFYNSFYYDPYFDLI